MTFLSLPIRFFLQFQLIYSSLCFKKFILKNLGKKYNFCHFIAIFGLGMMLLQRSCSCSCESAKCIKTQEYLKSNSPISFMHVACLSLYFQGGAILAPPEGFSHFQIPWGLGLNKVIDHTSLDTPQKKIQNTHCWDPQYMFRDDPGSTKKCWGKSSISKFFQKLIFYMGVVVGENDSKQK